MDKSGKSATRHMKLLLRGACCTLVALGLGIATMPQARAASITTLYSFGTKRRAPQQPVSAVTVFKGALYGELNGGRIFRFLPKRDKLRVVFDGAATGYDHEGTLVELDGSLYGFGEDQAGNLSLFKIDTLTHTAATVYAFNGLPGSSLAVFNGKLYGTMLNLGQNGTLIGTLFSFDPTSGTYTTVYTQTAEEGHRLPGGLTNHNGVLYGAAASDGFTTFNLFAFDPATGQEAIVHHFGADSQVTGRPMFGLLFHGNEVYGFTDDYTTDDVRIYRANIKTGGGSLLHLFDYQATAEFPNQSLVFQNGLLYGTLTSSNANPQGTIYTLDPKTGVLNTIYAFTGGADGGSPQAGLTSASGVLYGTTYTTEMGNYGGGTIFKLTP